MGTKTTGPLPPRCCNCNQHHAPGECPAIDSINHRQEAVDAAFQDSPDRFAPQLRQLTSAERKACPVVTGVLHYFPDAIMAIARVSKAGNDKHNPGQPLHWSRGKSNDHLDSEGRHLLTPTAMDPDSGQPEGAHKGWRALADLQIEEEKRLVALGIMPLSGVTAHE